MKNKFLLLAVHFRNLQVTRLLCCCAALLTLPSCNTIDPPYEAMPPAVRAFYAPDPSPQPALQAAPEPIATPAPKMASETRPAQKKYISLHFTKVRGSGPEEAIVLIENETITLCKQWKDGPLRGELMGYKITLKTNSEIEGEAWNGGEGQSMFIHLVRGTYTMVGNEGTACRGKFETID
ncbi:MAG: hypothetical protein WCO71_08870 [Pseudomonadota bacterium]